MIVNEVNSVDGYQLRTEKKKEQIRNVSMELFKEFGFEKVSLAEIARKANVSPVTIYNHFGTKDELVRDVIKTFLEKEWNNRLKVIQRDDLTYYEKVETIILNTGEISGVNSELLQKMLESDPELKEFVQDFFKERMIYVINFFEEGKKLGFVHPDVSTEAIMLYLNILQNAVRDSHFFNDNSSRNSKLGEELSRLFFYGFLVKPK